MEWETSLDTNFFRSRVSRRELRWLTIQKRRWLGRGGEEGYLHARLYACTRVLPLFFFSPASLLREGSNDPFKKIADLREGTLSFFFPLNCVRISENLLAKFLLEWKQGLEFYSKVVQKVCGVLI